MKKNLLSIIILGLLVVNIVLTTIMLFSITSSNKKTNSLISSIAQIVSLELTNGQEEEDTTVPIENVVTYEFEESLTIPLALDEDGKDHYAIVSVALAMNNAHDDYKKYSESIDSYKGLIQGEINEVIKSHTLADMKSNSDAVCEEILLRIQKMYDSDFIFKVSFKEIMWQ